MLVKFIVQQLQVAPILNPVYVKPNYYNMFVIQWNLQFMSNKYSKLTFDQDGLEFLHQGRPLL